MEGESLVGRHAHKKSWHQEHGLLSVRLAFNEEWNPAVCKACARASVRSAAAGVQCAVGAGQRVRCAQRVKAVRAAAVKAAAVQNAVCARVRVCVCAFRRSPAKRAKRTPTRNARKRAACVRARAFNGTQRQETELLSVPDVSGMNIE